MDYDTEPQHDEINLVRLLGRLEKSVASSEEWTLTTAQPREEVWLRAQKTIQNLNFARKLARNIEEDESEPSPKRIQRFNYIQGKLDCIEAFLKDVEKNSKPQSPKSPIPEPILPTLPKVPLAPSHDELPPDSQTLPVTEDWKDQPPSPRVSSQDSSISLPDPDEISPTLRSSALSSFLPSSLSWLYEYTNTSSTSRDFGPIPVIRKPPPLEDVNAPSAAMREELASKLAVMTEELRRNAMEFTAMLERENVPLEIARVTMERNYGTMQKESVRLRDHGKTRSTTCLVTGIVLLVMLVFMLMVSLIRFS